MTVFKKSLLTLGAAAVVLSFLLVLIVLLFMNSLYYETSASALKNTAKTLMTTIGNEKIAEVFADNSVGEIEMMIKASDVYRLTLVEPSGYVLWDSQVPGRLVNHIDREEITAALEGREAGARRDSLTTNMKQIYYALPVFDNNRVTGVFRLSISIPGFWARVSPVIYPFFVFSFFAAVIAFMIIYFFSRSLSSSICRLVDITQTGASLLSGFEADKKIAPEFKSLEKAIRAMTYELNFQLERAKTEGQRLEAILNGMTEAVFAADSELKLHLVNPRARKLFNIEESNVKTTLLEATRSAELTEAAKKALASGEASEMELTLRSGAEQQFHVFISPLAGARSGVVIVLLDVTQIVKLERVRKDFVANVSHELRTPIQLIKGFSETLLDTLSDGENGSKKQLIHFIEIINKNAATMENLTNDLLILADLENGSKNARDLEELYVARLINEAVSSVELQAKRKKIEIKIDCPGDLKFSLYGSFIVQALINLIDNAIKYSPPESKVWITAQDADGELVLQVRDKGIGIPSEHLERIFERFYRVDRSRSREAGGTGLGLSIVRHIALLHKGRVEAESHAGEGSVFRIIIPVQDQNQLPH